MANKEQIQKPNLHVGSEISRVQLQIEKTAADWVKSYFQMREADYDFLKPDDFNTELNKLKRNANAVNLAFLEILKTIKINKKGIYYLSKNHVQLIQSAAKESANSLKAKTSCDQYLYNLLLELTNQEIISYNLPLEIRKKPNRSSAFDAENPNLPLPTRFQSAQQLIASLALNVKNKIPTQSINNQSENEFCAIAALLAFGCYTSMNALKLLSQLTIEDYSGEENHLWLRNRSGQRFFKLTLHPVQALAIDFFLRRGTLINRSQKKNEPLFPVLADKNGRLRFSKWLKKKLDRTDIKCEYIHNESNPTNNKMGLKNLLAGAHRWMLDIYPVYLTAILAGHFDPTAESAKVSPKVSRENASSSVRIEEKKLRKRLRKEMYSYLSNPTDMISPENYESMFSNWDKSLISAGYPSLKQNDLSDLSLSFSETVDLPEWNLYFLARALGEKLRNLEVTRFNTFSNWFETGCTLLDGLGGQSFWNLNANSIKKITENLTSSAQRYAIPHLTAMATAASKANFQKTANLEELSKAAKQFVKTSSSRKSMKIAPSNDEIERLGKSLLAKSEDKVEIGSNKAEVVLFYSDLLLLGLRKNEAIKTRISDFDFLTSSEGKLISADLFIPGGKTPAARRAIPLTKAAFPASVNRIIEKVKFLKKRGENSFLISESLVSTALDKSVRRRRPVLSENEIILNSLDRSLKMAAESCRLNSPSPHLLRHSSISAMLEQGANATDFIGKIHGHRDLSTTFNYYIHSLSEIQENCLNHFLEFSEKETVWVALSDARDLIGISKQYLYKKYPKQLTNLGTHKSEREITNNAFVIKRPGKSVYVRSTSLLSDLMRHLNKISN